MYFTQKQVREAAGCDIAGMMRSVGADVRQIGQYFTLKEHDSVRIKGNQFVRYSTQARGNTIDFVKEIYSMDFVRAVDFILNHNYTPEPSAVRQDVHTENDTFFCPSEYSNRVIAYLCSTRKINYTIVKKLLQKGLLYQDQNGNAVFPWIYDNKCVGADLRGTLTYKKFTMIAKGSNGNFGYNIAIGKPEKMFVFEAAIDLLSFYQMFGAELHDCLLVSMSGLKQCVVKNMANLYGINVGNIILCVDHDEAGVAFVEKMTLAYPDMKHFVPMDCYKDWNEQLVAEWQEKNNKKEIVK